MGGPWAGEPELPCPLAVEQNLPWPCTGSTGQQVPHLNSRTRYQGSATLWGALPPETVIPPAQAAAAVEQDTGGSKLKLNEVLVSHGAGWVLGSIRLCKLEPCRHTGHSS